MTVGAVRLYQQTISRLLPGSCRFDPTCSEYVAQALERHGLVRGMWLAIKRIARCNPFFSGGPDPVPEAPDKKNSCKEAFTPPTAKTNANNQG